MLLETIIFYIAAGFALGGAAMMVSQRNPIASVLYLVVSLVAQAILYVQLSALFVGALLIIIYTGAILVLFLFVIMLLNLRGEQFHDKQSHLERATKLGLTLIFFIEAAIIIKQLVTPGTAGRAMLKLTEDFGSVEMVATRLFREYLFPFELTSILLLVAIVGAVVIAKRDKADRDEREEV
jgi:NADH-quinone oxidoreductase subunit J